MKSEFRFDEFGFARGRIATTRHADGIHRQGIGRNQVSLGYHHFCRLQCHCNFQTSENEASAVSASGAGLLCIAQRNMSWQCPFALAPEARPEAAAGGIYLFPTGSWSKPCFASQKPNCASDRRNPNGYNARDRCRVFRVVFMGLGDGAQNA